MKKQVRTAVLTADDIEHFADREHVLKRPDMYMASLDRNQRKECLFDFTKKRMYTAEFDLSQAMERMFLEILSNCGDNVDRSRKANYSVGIIDVRVDEKTVTIKNGGTPLPVDMNKKFQRYAPELAFGELRSGSSLKDDVARTGIGVNGIGSKLTNIFSKRFSVDIGNSLQHKRYRQTWSENMSIKTDPLIESYNDTESFVEISYDLDFEKLGCDRYSAETIALYARHAIDIGFTCKVPIIFNGNRFDTSDIMVYCSLYFSAEALKNTLVHFEFPEGTETIRKEETGIMVAKNPNVIPTLEVCIFDTPDTSEVMSFVNGMITRDGGAHVNSVYKAISNYLLTNLESSPVKTRSGGKETENKSLLNMADVKRHLSMIVNCKVEDPKFTSQSKTFLQAPAPQVNFTDKEMSVMKSWEVLDRLQADLEAKQFRTISKNDGKKKRHIDLKKLDDANLAGTARSRECTLFCVEGESASNYASKFIDNIDNGKDFNGVLPLKGKPLNIMNASVKQISDNKEIKYIKQALGLREKIDYTVEANFNSLRYGNFVILADSDDDGKHIIGLVINIFHCRYPSLLKRGFVKFMRTPILRMFKGSQACKFYTVGEFERWKTTMKDWNQWKAKYFKGLGSSNDKNVAEDYMSKLYITCVYDENAAKSINLAFNENLADERKVWLKDGSKPFDMAQQKQLPISQFINEEFILYSIADNQRSLPRLLDGLKESQRKILWSIFLYWKNFNNPEEIKTAQFSLNVAKETQYHHGEKIIDGTINCMTQDFLGANNISYFIGDGQFGTREHGGKKVAAARYTFIKPSPLLPYIYKSQDMPLLELKNDDGNVIEPVTMLPIIPMGLVNGCSGIGTGYSTFIPNYNPLDIVDWLRKRINNQQVPMLLPWYNGFKGRIEIKERRVKIRSKNKQEKGDGSEEKARIIKRGSAEIDEDALENQSKENLLDKCDELDLLADESDEEENEENKKIEKPGEWRTKNSFISYGNYVWKNDGTVHISELPIGKWTKAYTTDLKQMIFNKKISDMRDLSKSFNINIEIKGLDNPSTKNLRIERSYGLDNMVLLDNDDKIVHYKDVAMILETFYQRRLPYYEQRKNNIIKEINNKLEKVESKIKFISAIKNGSLKVINTDTATIEAQMITLGLDKSLLQHTTIKSLSKDNEEDLLLKRNEFVNERTFYVSTPYQSLWLSDLEQFEVQYRKFIS
jgi:DNA topoisomerase-2